MAAEADQKVVVHVRSTGDAPILKQSKFKTIFANVSTPYVPLKVSLENRVFLTDTLSGRLSLWDGGSMSLRKPWYNDLVQISGRDKFLKVIEFLRRQLHQDTLFVYINSSFSPNPDELVIDLYNNFGIDGKLVVNYALSAAWG